MVARRRLLLGLGSLSTLTLAMYPALALNLIEVRWKPEYTLNDQTRADFFSSLMVQPGVAKRLHLPDYYTSCCSNGDTIKTQFRVDKLSGADQWWYLWKGQWKLVPDDIIDPNRFSPYGAVLFVNTFDKKTPVCFIRPEGGI